MTRFYRFFDERFREDDFFEDERFLELDPFFEDERFFDDDFFDDDFFDERFFDDFVRPSLARSLFTVAAAIRFAVFVLRPRFFALDLMCSY